MWIKHKVKDGDTLDSIAKQYKNKDSRAILDYPENKTLYKRLKEQQKLRKGDVVWVLDPKGKVYIIEKKGRKAVLNEKEYKKFQKDITEYGFEINPHDPCVANKMVNGKQLTITWHVDDLKASHKQKEGKALSNGWKPNMAPKLTP